MLTLNLVSNLSLKFISIHYYHIINEISYLSLDKTFQKIRFDNQGK